VKREKLTSGIKLTVMEIGTEPVAEGVNVLAQALKVPQ
jgi:hypothetical protein